jgi:hypothetical protein
MLHAPFFGDHYVVTNCCRAALVYYTDFSLDKQLLTSLTLSLEESLVGLMFMLLTSVSILSASAFSLAPSVSADCRGSTNSSSSELTPAFIAFLITLVREELMLSPEDFEADAVDGDTGGDKGSMPRSDWLQVIVRS